MRKYIISLLLLTSLYACSHKCVFVGYEAEVEDETIISKDGISEDFSNDDLLQIHQYYLGVDFLEVEYRKNLKWKS